MRVQRVRHYVTGSKDAPAEPNILANDAHRVAKTHWVATSRSRRRRQEAPLGPREIEAEMASDRRELEAQYFQFNPMPRSKAPAV